MVSSYSFTIWSLSFWSEQSLQAASKQNMEIAFILGYFTRSVSILQSLQVHLYHVLTVTEWNASE